MEDQEFTEQIKAAHPVDAELFGVMGAAAAHLCEDLSSCFVDKQFEFMDLAVYQSLGSPAEMGRIYWREMLFRVYWAAALNLMRHQRWQSGCVRAFADPANLLAFAASLRGLLEAAQDAFYSLRQVPSLLAENRKSIETALKNNSLDGFGISQELEDRLIHFIYGRKIGKDENVPQSYVALEPKDYRNAIGLPADKRDNFRELYDQLCGICHPTAFSLVFLWDGEGERVQIKKGEDESFIRALCHKYEETISLALSLSVTMSSLSLKALNWFSVPEVACTEIERWNFDAIPAWRKAQAAAKSNGTVQ